MDAAELRNRFEYHPPKGPETASAHEVTREACATMAEFLNVVVPEGREKALAMTHLETVMFWANAAIARQS
jgi:hypothetical protein